MRQKGRFFLTHCMQWETGAALRRQGTVLCLQLRGEEGTGDGPLGGDRGRSFVSICEEQTEEGMGVEEMPSRDSSLYRYAKKMMESTNVFRKPLEEFHFMSAEEHREKSLAEMLREEITWEERRFGVDISLERNIRAQACFRAIGRAMAEYAEVYPSTYSFRQNIRVRFGEWMKVIQKKYRIPEAEIPEEFQIRDRDTVVAMLKLLHSREGMTKSGMREVLGITERAVLKDLTKLDPGLRENPTAPLESACGRSRGQSSEPDRFQIGGQPVDVKIRSFRAPGEKEKRYQTVNTLHPLVLQENMMQVGVLLTSLAHHWEEGESDSAFVIALDIWYQLSEYGKSRVRTVFTRDDDVLAHLVEEMDRCAPDEELAGFMTERQMVENYGAGIEETLLFYLKSNDRTCHLELETDQGIVILDRVRILPVEEHGHISGKRHISGAVKYYRAVTRSGEETLFHKEMIRRIE